jgi:hypothetical protein
MGWMRRLALFTLLMGAAGCMRFAARPVPAPEACGWRAIRQARVTTTESAYYVLRDVQVTADSVTGWDTASNRRRIALHRSQVRRFEQQRVDVIRTGLLATVGAYVAAVIISYRGADW